MSKNIIIQEFGLNNLSYGKYKAGVGATFLIPPSPGVEFYQGRLPIPNSQDAPIGRSTLGTPVFDTLIIKAGSYINSLGKTVSYGDFRIDNVLMTITQTNNVVITKIQGKDGEVIEYVGKDSFRVNIKGGVFSTNNIRPVSDIINLNLILGSNQPLVVKYSGFLSEWEITELVILSKHLPQVAGGYNYQLFDVDCIQNTSVILAQQTNVT